jgi:branched-subunit amino acid transport protein
MRVGLATSVSPSLPLFLLSSPQVLDSILSFLFFYLLSALIFKHILAQLGNFVKLVCGLGNISLRVFYCLAQELFVTEYSVNFFAIINYSGAPKELYTHTPSVAWGLGVL